MEKYFEEFRNQVIGAHQYYDTPYGRQKMIYADWVASGRLYQPIEDVIINQIGPFVGNTHTETSEAGTLMTKAYKYSHKIIKEHVNAGPQDVIITAGFGMTAVINKLQRMLGLKYCSRVTGKACNSQKDRPVVFITHMEHHSNHTSWFETTADVVMIEPAKDLLISLDNLREKLEEYKDRKLKIGAFTACSNVTGIETPYHEMSEIMHEYGGISIIDFAASAPYVDMDMHPENPNQKLDAIVFSPHKFLGGPGTSGVLIFDRNIYNSDTPDNPGGGTVDWTNAWGEYKYVEDIEIREDGGTPGFLQSIKTALAIRVKEKMGVDNIRKREEELVGKAFKGLRAIDGIHVLADKDEDRLGIMSFYHEEIHFNLLVRLLNDRFGIQVRGGCACAGTYGHYLLDVSYETSHAITSKINLGDLSDKPGWVRLSLHPVMTDLELDFIIDAIKQVAENHKEWDQDYIYIQNLNEFKHILERKDQTYKIEPWFVM